MTRFKIGERVRIEVVGDSVERWSRDHLAMLQGKEGTVSELLTAERMPGHPKTEPAYCVTFDAPLKNTWKWGSPISAHWFDESELQPAQQPEVSA